VGVRNTMKKVFNGLAIIATLLSAAIAIANNLDETGHNFYSSVKVDDPANHDLNMVEFTKNYYPKIYQYLILRGEEILVIGKTKAGDIEFSKLSKNKQTKYVISELTSELLMNKSRFSVFTMYKIENAKFAVIEAAHRNNIRVEIFYSKLGNDFQLINKKYVSLGTKLFFNDVNEDGYTDILVWGKTESDEKKPKNYGEMSVMLYDPIDAKFYQKRML
jgi:hypothetical protein